MLRTPFRNRLIITFFIAAAIISFTSVYLLHKRGEKSDEAYLHLIIQASRAVRDHYVDGIDEKKITQGMIEGMLLALDPHSSFLPPEALNEMETQISGSFGGVGLEIWMNDGKLTVVTPIDGTPAFKAGIQPGDYIWKINGIATGNMSINNAVRIMRGEKGTGVEITIIRKSASRPLLFRLKRDIIKIRSVRWSMPAPGYGLIRISQFQERTGEEFREALKKLNAASGGAMKGLILDLRYNPGGLVDSSVEVADRFIGDSRSEKVIVSLKGRIEDANHSYLSTPGKKEPMYPLIVLINSGSASASEIVAGALQDYGRAIILGKRSFGKGSVQSIIPVMGNSALKLTTARYYTPGGRSIQAKGIEPDIDIGTSPPVKVKDYPEYFAEKNLPGRIGPGVQKDDEKETGSGVKGSDKGYMQAGGDISNDMQLKRGLELLQAMTLVKKRVLNR